MPAAVTAIEQPLARSRAQRIVIDGVSIALPAVAAPCAQASRGGEVGREAEPVEIVEDGAVCTRAGIARDRGPRSAASPGHRLPARQAPHPVRIQHVAEVQLSRGRGRKPGQRRRQPGAAARVSGENPRSCSWFRQSLGSVMRCISPGARRPAGKARRASLLGISERMSNAARRDAPPGSYVTHHASRGLGRSS